MWGSFLIRSLCGWFSSHTLVNFARTFQDQLSLSAFLKIRMRSMHELQRENGKAWSTKHTYCWDRWHRLLILKVLWLWFPTSACVVAIPFASSYLLCDLLSAVSAVWFNSLCEIAMSKTQDPNTHPEVLTQKISIPEFPRDVCCAQHRRNPYKAACYGPSCSIGPSPCR